MRAPKPVACVCVCVCVCRDVTMDCRWTMVHVVLGRYFGELSPLVCIPSESDHGMAFIAFMAAIAKPVKGPVSASDQSMAPNLNRSLFF